MRRGVIGRRGLWTRPARCRAREGHRLSSLTLARLVRQLDSWPFLEREASRRDWAERLGDWVRPIDAIALQAALPVVSGPAREAKRLRAGGECVALQRQVQQVCADLWRSFDEVLSLEPPGAVADGQDTPAVVLRHRRFAADRQREMASRLAALRDSVRRALAGMSPRLRQLARLDAALERALAGQEQSLLSRWPGLLERRFEHFAAEAAGESIEGGHQRLGREVRELLRAELELRLEPVHGLIDAAGEDAEEWA
jgi:Protein of unknown function (DUF3348)